MSRNAPSRLISLAVALGLFLKKQCASKCPLFLQVKHTTSRAAKFDQAPRVKSYFCQLFLPYFQLKLSYNFFLDGLWGELSYGVLILFELNFNL